MKVLLSILSTLLFPIVALSQTLVRVDISGPAFVAEGGQAQFNATAVFDDGTTLDVTDGSVWSISPARAGTVLPGGMVLANGLAGCSLPARVSAAYAGFSGGQDVIVRDRGLAGSSLRFDGVDDYLSVPNSDSLRFGQQATIEFWVWVDSFPPGPSGDWIFTKSEGGPFYLAFPPGDGTPSPIGTAVVAFKIAPSNDSSAGVGAYGIVTHQWSHVAATIDTSIPIIQIYLDGMLAGSVGAYADGQPIPPNDLLNNSAPLLLGGLPPYPDNYCDIAVDEVRVWDVARTGEQINSAMFTRLEGTEPGLVGYWRLDEGEGQVVGDLSLFGNQGFLGSSAAAPDNADPDWGQSTAPIGSDRLAPVSDLTGDGLVGLDDLGRLLSHFGQPAEFENGDIDHDGDVDLTDLGTLLSGFGATCTG